ncbi:MAG: type II toxin-antitoxin system HipA family toxin [Oceanisphaera sp.]|uniref:type II toxin-antitoxin system HipA family toxin n=1 Tax=Oceanisphaera sp. TaxID=1929979 RepID=UPI003C75B9C2
MANLTVALNGIVVGTLQQQKSGALQFGYDAHWLERSGARGISLSLPLSEQPYSGSAVYNFFDNLLPDSDAIRTRIQARFKIPTKRPFDLLASIGRDCVGAIQIYPEESHIPSVNTVTADSLTEADIARLLKGYQTAPLGMTEETDDFRISMAGAQEKTALLWHKEQWHRPLGSTPTSHIFKLPIGYLSQHNIDLRKSAENEWLCLQIAKEFGLPTANANLACFEDQQVLIVERFDRRWSSDGSWLMRLPQEDFCQALGVSPALKYESDSGPSIAKSMELLKGSQQVTHDRETFFKSQVLFWLLAAIDGHAKNFSVFIEPGSAYRMTPLYDIISAYPLMSGKSIHPKKAKMAMAFLGKNRHFHWALIAPRHLKSTAEQVGYSSSKAEEMLVMMKQQTEAVVANIIARLPPDFSVDISQPIFDGLLRQAGRLPG